MEIHPSISERTTEQLLDIIETQDEWRPDVIDLARKELLSRGVTLKIQKTRRTIKIKFKERIAQIKERATYTAVEKILIVLLGPILVILLDDLFMFHPGEGYKKKNRQGFFYLFLGVLLWGLTFYIYFK
jgi:hypothetical protein